MRLKALDVLRAVAVLLVLGRHFGILDSWRMIGWTGVNLFFVLSGFLISGLLFTEYKKHAQIQVVHFLVRRGFKIYPPFYTMIAFTLAIFLFYHPVDSVPWQRFLGEVVPGDFLRTFRPGSDPSPRPRLARSDAGRQPSAAGSPRKGGPPPTPRRAAIRYSPTSPSVALRDSA